MAPGRAIVALLLVIMLMVNIGNNSCQGTHRETSILQSWLNEIQDPQAGLHDWVSSEVSPCNWAGIQCNAYSQVVQIELSNMGLSGALSPVLGELQMLIVFNVSKNNFNGDLPPEICSWENLQVFGLHSNSFAGPIPSCLSHLPQLRVMDFSYNSFTSLPASIGVSPQLSVLNLEGCALIGSIPSDVGSITTLTSLSLGGNQLTGFIPPQLGLLWRLRRLHLGYNNLVGGVPSALGMLGSLQFMNLAENNLSGTIPTTLWNLEYLEEVYLFGNDLTGAIPASIGSGAGLVTVDLSDNSLSGSIPQTIGSVTSLEVLNLSKNELVGQIPAALSTLPGLRVLSLSQNKLTGSIPEGFGAHFNISTLDLSSNQLVGYIPHGLCSSGGLSDLDLSSNFLHDSIPLDLQSCSSLQRISVANNSLLGTLAGIGALPLLRYLDMSSNQMGGTLESAQFSNASAALVEIHLQNNQFTGPLPDSIGHIPNLGKLDVSHNNLTGEIPPQLGDCAKLTRLSMAGNDLSGPIPQEISNCTQLRVINLSWNALNGTIPVQLDSLLAMEDLDLSHNQLSGSIPRELASSSLHYLDLSHNNFSGPVPVDGMFKTINNISLAGNKYLCGGLIKLHLPLCPKESISPAVKILTVVLVGLSVLLFATAFWWQGRPLGTFQDMKASAVNNGSTSAALTKDKDVSIWDPEMESVRVQEEDDEEMTVFHRGDVHTVLSERDEGKDVSEAVSSPYTRTLLTTSISGVTQRSRQRWQPLNEVWKVISLVPELDLTEDEVRHTCAPQKLIGSARSAELFAGVTKNGLQFVVERQLRPATGDNLSIALRRLGQCKHPHIVKMFGYCLDSGNSLVAVLYEHMGGGHLREALQSGRLASRRLLRWGCRFDIALGIVRALHYLHENQPAYAPPLHYKITSSEIILDLDMKAYLLARVDLSDIDQVANPESAGSLRTSSSSEKMLSSSCTDGTDIYDLGVVLLELLSGRQVKAPNGMTIVDWFDRCSEMESGIQDMLDPTLGNHISTIAFNQIGSVFSLASRCIAKGPDERPSLDEVLLYLLRISKSTATADEQTLVWLRRPSRLSRALS